MITVTCLYCGKDFEAKRSTAKFCSPNCRVAAGRKPNPKNAIAFTDGTLTVKKGTKKEQFLSTSATVLHTIKNGDDSWNEVTRYEKEVGERFIQICSFKSVPVEEGLNWFEENYGRKPDRARKQEKKESSEEKTDAPVPKFQNELWARKMGIKKA